MTIDYLMLGHITRDVAPDGSTTPGGTALYAAATAFRLGRCPAIVSAPAPMPKHWPASIALAGIHGEPPVFENRYEERGRTQLLHQAGTPLHLGHVPHSWRSTPLVHIGPVIGEVHEALIHAFAGAFIGVTPQGWMRDWATPLPSPVWYRAWQPEAAVLQRINALVMSSEDIQGEEGVAATYAQACGIVALTHGAGGATLFVDGVATHIPAFPAVEHDPTGAGDVFAASLFVALQTGAAPEDAARSAARIAAASVEHRGVQGVLRMRLPA